MGIHDKLKLDVLYLYNLIDPPLLTNITEVRPWNRQIHNALRMIHCEFLREIAHANFVFFFEGNHPWFRMKIEETEDDIATVAHVPDELGFFVLKVEAFDDSLLDEILNLELEVPFARICLHNDADVDELPCQRKNVVHVQTEVTLVKSCRYKLDVGLIAPGDNDCVH